jgi:uridine kinase
MTKLNNIYWIGGSPCSGKSSIAEKLAREFSLLYYKCDDHMMSHINRGAQNDILIMKKYSVMSKDENWLRDIDSQVTDVLEFYRNSFDFILEDLAQTPLDKVVLVEGSAILPELIKKHSIDPKKYICLVPTPEFQLTKYPEREWVKDYLVDCSNPSLAFSNWMKRDMMFAGRILKSAKELDLFVLNVDGSKTIDENFEITRKHFGW